MLFVFDDCEIDADRRELRRAGNVVHVEPQVFDVLLYLIRHRARVVTKDDLMKEVWCARIVSEATLTSRIAAARRAIGDTGKQQARLRTLARKGFRFVGEVREENPSRVSSDTGAAPGAAEISGARAAVPLQEIRFCCTSDGVRLAYAAVGSGPILVKATNWLSHLEYDWQSPVWSPTLARLAEQYRLIRYDGRGLGLSAQAVSAQCVPARALPHDALPDNAMPDNALPDDALPDLSFEAHVRDLESIVDQLGLDSFPLLGMSGGVPLSIAYAVRHPDRVSRLVLVGGFAQGWLARGSPAEIAQREALITMIRHGWGQDNPAFHQLFTALFVPGGTPDQHRWFEELQQVTVPVVNAVRLARVFGEIDVTPLLSQVTVPALLLHSRRDARVPFEQSLLMARALPNARLVALDSSNHIVLAGEAAWHRLMGEISAFLAEPAG